MSKPRFSTTPRREPDALTLAALTWLASGLFLLVLTPLPMHDVTWGWSLTFWLAVAPLALLAALHPRAAMRPALLLLRPALQNRPRR